MHTNQRLLVEELIRRGARVETIDASIELIEATFQGRSEYILDRSGKAVSHVASVLAADKHLSKKALRARGVDCPQGALFGAGQIDEAIARGVALGFPLVAKPNVGSNGKGVHSGIGDADRLEAAICSLLLEAGPRAHFIVERHMEGQEFRIFITTQGDFAVLLREPASVVGDGLSTIEDLARAESARRVEAKQRCGSALSPIVLDEIVVDHLRSQNMLMGSVPAMRQKIVLRLGSNLSQGGSSTDMTERAHPTSIAIARRALAAFDGLPCLGIDFICPDIELPIGPSNPYAIIEVNANPGLAMHHMPAIGRPRDVARYLADAMFAELFGQ